MRHGGLVLSRKEGKQVFHRADGAGMAERLGALQVPGRCCSPGCP
ncbi:hypothetical protein ACIO93_34795 [Streptomyces sp. NPDC087903]